MIPPALACLLLASGDPPPTPPTPAPAFAAAGADAVQDLVILAEGRPIFLRFRVLVDDAPFRAAPAAAARAVFARLDADGDGRLAPAEAEANGLASFLPPPPAGKSHPEVDANPKDGQITVAELAEALGGAAGGFRVQVDGAAGGRTDPLFDHLDRDQDGSLTRPELATVGGTLRKLDRDDNELIAADEAQAAAITPATAPAAGDRPARDAGVPSAVAIEPGESPLRLARLLIRKYDVGSGRGPGKTDSRLAPEEFAIPPAAFAALDGNGDQLLTAEELRKGYAQGPADATVDVAFPADPAGRAAVRVEGADGHPPAGMVVRTPGDDVVEIDLGPIRLDIHVDAGGGIVDAARAGFRGLFAAADANKDDYLEADELTLDNGQPAPLNGLFATLDRNHDGKVYPPELDLYVADQAAVARSRLALRATNQGRALFGLLDLDRDRQLGAREVLDAVARLATCDRDGDGRVAADEVPHHIRLVLARGELADVLAAAAGPAAPQAGRAAAIGPPPRTRPGPAWFRRMDRNHDGDVSRREFLGTIEQYDRLDADRDGLLGPAEADAAGPVRGPGG